MDYITSIKSPNLTQDAKTVAHYYWAHPNDFDDNRDAFRYVKKEWYVQTILCKNSDDEFQQSYKNEVLKLAFKALIYPHNSLDDVSGRISEPLLKISNPFIYEESLAQYFAIAAKARSEFGIYTDKLLEVNLSAVETIMHRLFLSSKEHLKKFKLSEINHQGQLQDGWKIYPKRLNFSKNGVVIEIAEEQTFIVGPRAEFQTIQVVNQIGNVSNVSNKKEVDHLKKIRQSLADKNIYLNQLFRH